MGRGVFACACACAASRVCRVWVVALAAARRRRVWEGGHPLRLREVTSVATMWAVRAECCGRGELLSLYRSPASYNTKDASRSTRSGQYEVPEDRERSRLTRSELTTVHRKFSHSRSPTRTAAAAMSALDGAGAVHSMLSYELCERGVLVQ